jgi:hypothetical protein
VRGPGGPIEGVIDIASDATMQVLGNRRLELGHFAADAEDDVVLAVIRAARRETVPRAAELINGGW